MMKEYTLTQALVFLNQRYPGAAPTNVVTLRRAIQAGELKANVRLGRNGTSILESDLIAYSEKYRSPLDKSVGSPLPSASELEGAMDILQKFTGAASAAGSYEYRLELMRARGRWEKLRGELMRRINDLNIELQTCKDELSAIDNELNRK